MGSFRTPGSANQVTKPINCKNGILYLNAPPTCGCVGKGDGVASWESSQKLLHAAQLAADKLPADMQEEFASLFTPESIGITVGVLGTWAASHAIGIGQGVDAVLLAWGLYALGGQAIDIAKDIWRFVTEAIDASSQRELDDAASCLARAVALIGVGAFVAFIMRAGGKLKRTKPGRDGLTEWLNKLGRPKEPPQVRQKIKMAGEFFSNYVDDAKVVEFLKGIDFSKNVGRTTFLRDGPSKSSKGRSAMTVGPSPQSIEVDPNNILVQWSGSRVGNWFSKSGVSADKIGLSDARRRLRYFRVKKDVSVLESYAIETSDTWTPGRTRNVTSPQLDLRPKSGPWGSRKPEKGIVPELDTNPVAGKAGELVGGGGKQYFVPDPMAYLEEITFRLSER